LAERKKEDVTTSLKIVLMFAIPMTVVAIALSDTYVTLLRRDYPDAGMVLIVLAVDTLIMVTSSIFGSVLFGMESLDKDEKISFKSLVKSRLFIVFSMPYIRSAIVLPITYYVLTTPYAFNQPLQAAFSISVITLAGHLFTFSALYVLARKTIHFDIPWKSISKYVLASAVTGVLLFLLPHPAVIPATTTTMEIIFNIAQTLVLTAIGAVVYLGIVMAIDKEARTLPKAILQEIRGRKRSNE
jgi:hypothetical protein